MSEDERVKRLAELGMIINDKIHKTESELKMWTEVASFIEETLRGKSFKTIEPQKQSPMPLHLQKEPKYECFGTANTSDECARCSDNAECLQETIMVHKQQAEKPKVQQKLSKDKIVFPDVFANMLDVTETEDAIVIKGKHFIRDKRDFKEITGIVKQYGGEYVSAGKNSHWKIPK